MAVSININKERYRVPERLDIKTYSAALQFDWEDPKYYPKIVSELTDAPISQLAKAEEDSLVLAMSLLTHVMNQRTECNMKDLTELTFGEFIDLDVWISLGVTKHLQDMANILCPKAKWSDQAMWAVDKFAEFRMYMYRQYKVLFDLTDKDLEEAKEKLEITIDPMSIARSWYKVIVSLANEDILNIDRVTEEPLKKALNFMALQKEKALEEREKQLQQKRKYDLQANRR